MEATWTTAAQTIGEVLAQAGIEGSQIAAVGLSGNMIGAWLVDAQGQPVRDAMLWNDGRTQPLIERLNRQRPGFASEVFGYSGSVLEYGATLPLVRWLADHEPDSLKRAAVVLHSKDWVRYKLTGTLLTDVSEVPGLPGDARRQDYAEPLFDLFGLRPYRHLFPAFVASETVVGTVQRDAAAQTGLLEGTPVVAGAGDVPAVTLGVGAVEAGVACSILGTHSINGIVLDTPSFEPADLGLLFTIPGRRWLRALTNVAGTTNLDWFAAQFCDSEVRASASSGELFAALERLAGESEPGARGVVYHPYLSAVGIIAPVFEPAARAQFFGLIPEHTRADLLRAVYEGVALAIRDCYVAIGTRVSEIRLSGGGARSPLWGQIIADVTGTRVIVPAGTEFGAKGAALLAGVGIGWFASIGDAARQAVRIERVYTPDDSLRGLYDGRYALYCGLREALRPLWQQAAHPV